MHNTNTVQTKALNTTQGYFSIRRYAVRTSLKVDLVPYRLPYPVVTTFLHFYKLCWFGEVMGRRSPGTARENGCADSDPRPNSLPTTVVRKIANSEGNWD
jgi:hypothetical protein